MDTVISRQEAIASGLKHYFTGNPCPQGHVAQRRVSGECMACRSEAKKKPEVAARWLTKLVEYGKSRPEIRKAARAAGKARVARQTPPWYDPAACREVYREATEATLRTGIPHHVDHIIPIKGKLVSGLHVHQNLRVLPWLDNIKKSNRFDPEMH